MPNRKQTDAERQVAAELFQDATISPGKALAWLDIRFPAHKRLSSRMARRVGRLRKNLLAAIRAEAKASRQQKQTPAGDKPAATP